jgi:hypothetical protein
MAAVWLRSPTNVGGITLSELGNEVILLQESQTHAEGHLVRVVDACGCRKKGGTRTGDLRRDRPVSRVAR